VTPMKVARRGTVEFDGLTLRYDGWIIEGGRRRFASEHELLREARTAIFIEVARIAGVYLEPMELDMTAFSYSPCLRHEREAREEIERIRAAAAPRRPWWRFWA
jgi:hypothetical protein